MSDNYEKHDHNHERNKPIGWSEISYPGERHVPIPEEPGSGSWPTVFFKRNHHGKFLDKKGHIIPFEIRRPDIGIDFEGEELRAVEDTLKYLNRHEETVATYWGEGPATKQWTPIIDKLIDTYGISAPRAGRILASVQSALNDAFVIAWYFKFKWDIARPNQLNKDLEPFLDTPRHPTYPSGHATVAGAAQVVLSYFFKPEKHKLKDLAEECALSRLYGGVHFPIDNDEGLRLGRHIGRLVVEQLKKQYDKDGTRIDLRIKDFKDAKLIPPPYKQAIPFNRDKKHEHDHAPLFYRDFL
ncbi:vanadium-dependent haloperoxidase [Mycoplasmatota bacterium WC44]